MQVPGSLSVGPPALAASVRGRRSRAKRRGCPQPVGAEVHCSAWSFEQERRNATVDGSLRTSRYEGFRPMSCSGITVAFLRLIFEASRGRDKGRFAQRTGRSVKTGQYAMSNQANGGRYKPPQRGATQTGGIGRVDGSQSRSETTGCACRHWDCTREGYGNKTSRRRCKWGERGRKHLVRLNCLQVGEIRACPQRQSTPTFRWRRSGEDRGEGGYRCRWTVMGGAARDGSWEFKETVRVVIFSGSATNVASAHKVPGHALGTADSLGERQRIASLA